MTLDIEIGGRLYRASVTRAGRTDGRLEVTVQAHDDPELSPPLLLDVRETDVGLSLVDADGRVIDAALAEPVRGEWLVQLPHVDVVARVDGRRAHAGGGEAQGTGPYRLSAPMPGRIVRILVRSGDEVAVGQPLVVMEAMKMENALTAQRAGVVAEVAVAEGASVESGRLLVTVQ